MLQHLCSDRMSTKLDKSGKITNFSQNFTKLTNVIFNSCLSVLGREVANSDLLVSLFLSTLRDFIFIMHQASLVLLVILILNSTWVHLGRESPELATGWKPLFRSCENNFDCKVGEFARVHFDRDLCELAVADYLVSKSWESILFVKQEILSQLLNICFQVVLVNFDYDFLELTTARIEEVWF